MHLKVTQATSGAWVVGRVCTEGGGPSGICHSTASITTLSQLCPEKDFAFNEPKSQERDYMRVTILLSQGQVC